MISLALFVFQHDVDFSLFCSPRALRNGEKAELNFPLLAPAWCWWFISGFASNFLAFYSGTELSQDQPRRHGANRGMRIDSTSPLEEQWKRREREGAEAGAEPQATASRPAHSRAVD
ncbi:hypothetical protein RB195_005000 [Necator americanus]|uniref:Uncharacterized protein n=1 Tax=Necator americanus TaxID=51031 RepID=A0ABR1BP81_NECAM